MMYDSDDALDRALFALPLEEPPSDLRAAILARTAFRPASPFGVWEVAALGSLAAVLVWLIVSIALGGGGLFVETASAIGSGIADALANVTVLAWVAAGAVTAYWLTVLTASHPISAIAERFEHRSGR